MAIDDSLYWRLMTLFLTGALLGSTYVETDTGAALASCCFGALTVLVLGRLGNAVYDYRQASAIDAAAKRDAAQAVPAADVRDVGAVPRQRGGSPGGSGYDRNVGARAW